MIVLSLATFTAFWSVWIDYAARIAADPTRVVHLLAALVGAVSLWRSAAPDAGLWTRRASLMLALACLAGYALGHGSLPAMARCLLALVAVGACIVWQRGSERPWLGFAFLGLGVPMLSQLDSLIGVSLRLSVADAAAAVVRIPGLLVTSEGTRLVWAGGAVDVDAPCSGLRMIWTGGLVTLLALWHFRLRAAASALVSVGALALLWLGNVMRCAGLFYVESGLVGAPSWSHGALGTVVFAGVALALWEGTRRLVEWRPSWAS